MDAEYGCSERGLKTLLYKNFEYLKERDNVCGTTSWRCRKYHNLKCKARVVTSSGLRIVSEKESEHNHSGNSSAARARKAIGEMKNKVQDMTATPSSSQVAVTVANDVLMALPKRATLTRVLQRHRQKINTAAHGGIPLPRIPVDL